VTEGDEPDDEGGSPEPFEPDDEDDVAAHAPSWLGAIAQMIAAVLVVVALVALFIVGAAALRRLLP
jgi:hypothetical protein